jgi:integrase
VFCNSTGGPLRRSHFHANVFKPLLENAGLAPIRFHDLRHTSATLLLTAGVHPKVVQERLGHSQIAITLDTYSHVMPSLQLDAAEKLDALLPE